MGHVVFGSLVARLTSWVASTADVDHGVGSVSDALTLLTGRPEAVVWQLVALGATQILSPPVSNSFLAPSLRRHPAARV